MARWTRADKGSEPAAKPVPTRSERLAGIALVNLATFCWATNIVLGRSLRFDVGPLTLAALRFVVGSALYAALLQREAPEQRRPGTDWPLLLAMGIAGVAMFAPLQYLGLRYTTAANAALLQALAPLITGLLAALLIGERMSRYQVIAAVVSLLGVLVLISGGSLAFWRTIESSIGDLIILVAVSLWALYTVISRRVTAKRPVLSATGLSTWFGVPFLLVAMIWEWQTRAMQITPGLVLAILYIGVSPTVIGFLSWNGGVRRLGPSGAMVFYNTLPLYGGLLAYLFLGEEIGWAHLAGGAMIIGAGIWAARAQSKAAQKATPG
jgi:drug/metabolite transporter (DMT)-like permease